MRPAAGSTGSRVLVVIPVYGHQAMTHDLIGDLDDERELIDVVVVDNMGDYEARAGEIVMRPGQNLGWAGGTNAGTAEHLHDSHLGVMWLNNDTRLSRGFVRNVVLAARESGAGIVGPAYDCFWVHQHLGRPAEAKAYRPRAGYRRVGFVDGTCMFVTSRTIERNGLLDHETFSHAGWGAELDYCFRAGARRIPIIVTRRAYLQHLRAVTAHTVYGGVEGYAEEAFGPMQDGLRRKWGSDWHEFGGIDPIRRQTSPQRWRRVRTPRVLVDWRGGRG